jgi:1-acyl-sn-glycerol-3-phosphate acyltransferase
VLAAFSAFYWAFFALTLPPLFLGALLLFLVTAPFDRRRVVLHLYSCLWASLYVYVNPLWRCRVVGRERLPWRGAAVIVANHLSIADILVLYGLYRPFKWVSKSSVFRVPFLGWNMALNGYVPVTRGAAESVRRMLARCRELLDQGSPLLLFPEGTRSVTGELQPFKDGAFRLAAEAGVPVIPVALSGTFESVPKHGVVMRDRMDAVVEVLEPLDPRAFADAGALRDAARASIAAALARRSAAGGVRPAAPGG